MVLKSLTDCLRGSPKGPTIISWDTSMATAFKRAKQLLTSAPWLVYLNKVAKLSVAVNASATHVGRAFSSNGPGQQDVFFSKKLDPAQVEYSAFDRELLACFLVIHHFRYMLEGQAFTIYRLQAADYRYPLFLGPMDSQVVLATRLCGQVHIRCPAHCWYQHCGGRHAVLLPENLRAHLQLSV